MESQPQNPEFRNNPENFHPYFMHFFIDKYKIVSWHLVDNKKI